MATRKKNLNSKKSSITVKFGGSSLANAKSFKNVKKIILANPKRKYVVVSAPGKDDVSKEKVTDMLFKLASLVSQKRSIKSLWGKVAFRFSSIIKDLKLEKSTDKLLQEVLDSITKNPYKDFIVSRGEYLNARIMTEFLRSSDSNVNFVDAKDVIIFNSSGALDYKKTCNAIRKNCSGKGFFVIPGFYGIDSKNKIKTFPRGGSDISGALIACGLRTHIYENWTDVSGFYTADPKKTKNAKHISQMSYKEARALSLAGATVLHAETIDYLIRESIVLIIKNTNRPKDSGTLITPNSKK